MDDPCTSRDGIRLFRPVGPFTLVSAVEAIRDAIDDCRALGARWLLANATGMTGISQPTLVDRFLAVEEWAETASGMVTVALVIHADKIHPQKFGITVAEHFGLVADVYADEDEAFAWLHRHMQAAG
jgi:hypothetical protein